MAQNPSHLYIPDRQFVVLQDGRRIWSTGEVEYPDGYIGYVGSAGIVPPADGSHGTFYDPFRRFFIIVSDSGYTSTQESRQEAGSSVPANQSEINGESRLGNRTTTTIGQPPPNSDPSAGFYRAYVKFMDGKKVSEAKLREHLETFGPIGPYLRPSPKTKKNHSAYAEFRTYDGFQAAKAAGLHALSDVQLLVMDREDQATLLKKNIHAAAGNGPPQPTPPVPGFADRGGRSPSHGLPPSQLSPITTSPHIPNDPNSASTFSSSPTPGRYEPGTRLVPDPSFGGGPGLPMRNRANTIRNDSRPGRRPSLAVTDEQRSNLFADLGNRRGVPSHHFQPTSPLNTNFDNYTQRIDANANNTSSTAAVPGPLHQNVVGQYTSHADTTGRPVNLPIVQQGTSGFRPSTTGFSSTFRGGPEHQYTQTTRAPADTESSNSRQHQQQPPPPPPPPNNPSPSIPRQQPPPSQTTDLNNNTDPIKEECSFHSGLSSTTSWCDCADLFPNCKWPEPCDCPRPNCNPPPPPSPSAIPAVAPVVRTTRPPLDVGGSSSDFVIPKKGERKGLDFFTPGGEKILFKREDGGGKGKGKGKGPGGDGKYGGGEGAGGTAA